MAVFEDGASAITLSAGDAGDATFVIGSAVPHGHPLHLGYYSVHTTQDGLDRGEARIAELRRALVAAGDRRTRSGTTPVFR